MASLLEIQIGGLHALEELGRRLKEADRADLRRKLTRSIRRAAKPIMDAQRREVRQLEHAPSQWRDQSAEALKISVRTSGRQAGVRIRVSGKDEDVARHARNLNKGHWRHPLFGNRDFWYDQRVNPGWFDRPARKGAPHVRRQLERVLADIASEIEG